MKTMLICALLLAIPGINLGLYHFAHAQAVAEVADAGPPIDALPPADGVGSSPAATAPIPAAVSAIEWNPLGWDWPWILATLVTVLGGIITALRPIAAATKWSGDNWALAKLEWVLATIVKLFLPAKMRA